MSKFEKSSYDATKTILKHNDFIATPVLVDKTGVIVNDEGKYIVKAGTIVGGNSKAVLDNPTEPVVEKNDPPVAASVELEIDNTPDAEVGILVTAVEPGEAGNDLKIQLKNPGVINSPLSVEIDEETIIVNLETDGTAAVAAKKDFDNASPDANSKVTVTAKEAGTIGNSIKVQLKNPAAANSPLSVEIDEETIIVNLETDGTDAVAADLEIDITTPDDNSKVTVTAKEAGTIGNSIKVEFKDPSGNNQALAVSIVGDTIVVSLATGGTGAITSTAKNVADAINAHLIAKQLVTATYSGDGSTVVEAEAATALSGGAAAIAGDIVSTAAEVAAAINAHLIAKQLVTAVASGDGSTVVEAEAATALSGGAAAIAGDIVSTVAEVVDAINGHFDVAKLIKAEAIGEDSGLVIAVAATPLAGGDDGSGYEAEGVLLYDVDVTHGDAPGAMIVWGFIDKSKLDEDPCEDAVEALKGRILFFDV